MAEKERRYGNRPEPEDRLAPSGSQAIQRPGGGDEDDEPESGHQQLEPEEVGRRRRGDERRHDERRERERRVLDGEVAVRDVAVEDASREVLVVADVAPQAVRDETPLGEHAEQQVDRSRDERVAGPPAHRQPDVGATGGLTANTSPRSVSSSQFAATPIR